MDNATSELGVLNSAVPGAGTFGLLSWPVGVSIDVRLE